MSSDSAVSLEFLACGNGSLRGLALGFEPLGLARALARILVLIATLTRRVSGSGLRALVLGEWIV